MLKKLKPVEQTSLPNRANALDGLQIWMEASNGHRDVLSIGNSMIMAENIQENRRTSVHSHQRQNRRTYLPKE